MAQQRSCMFCLKQGHAKISKEHVWPQWTGRAIGAGRVVRTGMVRHRRNAESQHRVWSGKGPTNLQVNDVCERCNSGWLSELEERARPILTPMIGGNVAILVQRTDCEAVAEWALKMSIVSDATLKIEERFFVAPDRWRFMRQRSVPYVYTHVFAAAYRGTGYKLMSWSHIFPSVVGPLNDLDRCRIGRTRVMTVVIGHLVLQVWTMRFRGNKGMAVSTPIDMTLVGTEIPVHEVSQFQWPPRRTLNDEGLMYMAERFRPTDEEYAKHKAAYDELFRRLQAENADAQNTVRNLG